MDVQLRHLKLLCHAIMSVWIKCLFESITRRKYEGKRMCVPYKVVTVFI